MKQSDSKNDDQACYNLTREQLGTTNNIKARKKKKQRRQDGKEPHGHKPQCRIDLQDPKNYTQNKKCSDSYLEAPYKSETKTIGTPECGDIKDQHYAKHSDAHFRKIVG